jgi:hypothetical protein
VRGWYALYLGRQAVGGEERAWVRLFQAGWTEEQVLGALLASDEFFQRTAALVGAAGRPSTTTFLQALYTELLHRPASLAELGLWGNPVGAAGRYAVVTTMLQSVEYRSRAVRADYRLLLGRPASPGEVNLWARSALDLTGIRVGIEASLEFFFRVIGFAG